MYNLIRQCNSGGKMTPFAAKLVSNKPCYIFFATRSKVSQKNVLSELSVLIGRSILHFLAATFPATAASQFKLDLKERATT